MQRVSKCKQMIITNKNLTLPYLKLLKEAGFAEITAFFFRLESINATWYISSIHTSRVHRLQRQQLVLLLLVYYYKYYNNNDNNNNKQQLLPLLQLLLQLLTAAVNVYWSSAIYDNLYHYIIKKSFWGQICVLTKNTRWPGAVILQHRAAKSFTRNLTFWRQNWQPDCSCPEKQRTHQF